MHSKRRDFSKNYEKPEAAPAQFATSVPQGIQLGQRKEGKGTNSPEVKKLSAFAKALASDYGIFTTVDGKVSVKNDGNDSEVYTCI